MSRKQKVLVYHLVGFGVAIAFAIMVFLAATAPLGSTMSAEKIVEMQIVPASDTCYVSEVPVIKGVVINPLVGGLGGGWSMPVVGQSYVEYLNDRGQLVKTNYTPGKKLVVGDNPSFRTFGCPPK